MHKRTVCYEFHLLYNGWKPFSFLSCLIFLATFFLPCKTFAIATSYGKTKLSALELSL